MTKKIAIFIALWVAVVFLINVPAICLAQSADNTGINKRDQSKQELTAGQQGETKQDREITQKIRRAIVTDKSLSTNAHNVKIITVGGMVTLKGPVRSEEEKRAVEEKAAQIAGKDNIKSEIGIAPKKIRK
jgi:osmotically-inducible protein OsmY